MGACQTVMELLFLPVRGVDDQLKEKEQERRRRVRLSSELSRHENLENFIPAGPLQALKPYKTWVGNRCFWIARRIRVCNF